jgi:hypothetical protein
MIEMGLIVALGLVVTFCKLSWRSRLKMLGHPLAMDILVFVLLNLLHWGTFSGLMVAASGALFCSLTISFGRFMFGWISNNTYFPGRINVVGKLR